MNYFNEYSFCEGLLVQINTIIIRTYLIIHINKIVFVANIIFNLV